MKEDLTVFENFNDFFAWYINVIKSKVDGFNVTMSYQEIHLRVGLLTKEQQQFTEKMIRRIQNLPKNLPIIFTNYNDIGTFAARWNGQQKKAEILYPSVCYYWLRFPEMVKAAIQHELGHIVNRDIFYKSEYGDEYAKTHQNCINRSMDCRINQNLDENTLDFINRCLFTFNNEPTECIIPKTFAVKQCGLPISLQGKLTWTLIHKGYHNQHPEPMPDENEEEVELGLGDYVMTLVEKNGVPKGTYGRILEIYPDHKYQLVKITDEEIKALKEDNYKFFENFNDYISVLGGSFLIINDKAYVEANTIIEPYQYLLTNKEIKVIPVPKYTETHPESGMIALALRDINNIPEANFALITDVIDVNDKKYKLLEFNEEVQRIIGKGDAKAYYELFKQGVDMFTDNHEIAIYTEDFTLKNLSPPNENPPPPKPPKEKEVNKPKVGDIVVISKEDNRGKYGVIKAISEDGKYQIDEVSEKVAKSMVAKRESRNV